MGVSTSLFSGLSGLKVHQRRMDVIGNNVANVNTPGFRSSRVLFRTAFAQTQSIGTSPSGDLGGVNPIQVGLGTTLGSTTTNFSQGSLETTGVASDIGISGAKNRLMLFKRGQKIGTYTEAEGFAKFREEIIAACE